MLVRTALRVQRRDHMVRYSIRSWVTLKNRYKAGKGDTPINSTILPSALHIRQHPVSNEYESESDGVCTEPKEDAYICQRLCGVPAIASFNPPSNL